MSSIPVKLARVESPKITLIISAFLIGVCALPAQEPRQPPGAALQPNRERARNFFGLAAAPDPAAVERGQKLFVANCGFCHGSNATGGNSGPDLVRSVLVLHDEGSGSQIGPVILNGRPARGMPKFDMTDAQIRDIAVFLLARTQAAVNRMAYKILNVVTGDAAAGEAYFQRHCGSCHSPGGDLAHVASKYEAVALQSRFLYPVTRSFPGAPEPPPDPRAQTTVTVTPPSGQPVSGILRRLDDFSVSLTDSSGEYHAWLLEPGNGVKVDVHDPLKGHEDLLRQYTDADMHNILAYLETLK